MSGNDYYKTLGVAQNASAEDIKKAYRKLALETHPDRNPGDSRAEERFKRVNEAYGVLSDPQKRSQYDEYQRIGFHERPGRPAQGGFGYSQEEIFRDFFGSRQAQDVFAEMQREFQRMGFRFDDTYINRLFFGDKTVFFQGIFWGGPGGGTRIFRSGNIGASRRNRTSGHEAVRQSPVIEQRGLLQEGASLLAKAGKKIGSYLLRKIIGGNGSSAPSSSNKISGSQGVDVVYELTISQGEAILGTTVEIELPHWENEKRVSVRIPPGVQSSSKLRLKEMGRSYTNKPDKRGDLYIQLRVM